MSPASPAIPIISRLMEGASYICHKIVSQDRCDNPKLFRDRLCKALQDRGTSPGLEGSSDSRSARVSPLLGSMLQFIILVSRWAKRATCTASDSQVTASPIQQRWDQPLIRQLAGKCAFAGDQSNGAVLLEEEEWRWPGELWLLWPRQK